MFKIAHIPLFLTWALTTTASAAEDCTPKQSNVRKSKHVMASNFGSIAFSQSSNPARLTKADGINCIQLSTRKRIYFWVNHKGEFDQSSASFLAVQIVKTFPNSAKYRFKYTTHGTRKGSWKRKQEELPEILPTMQSFGKMTPLEFVKLHESATNRSDGGKLNDELLIKNFRNRFWHASPSNSQYSSLDWPDYWSGNIDPNQNTKIENFLIRFETVPQDETPIKHKTGIPFNTGMPKGLVAMEVRVFSPLADEFTHRITLKLK